MVSGKGNPEATERNSEWGEGKLGVAERNPEGKKSH